MIVLLLACADVPAVAGEPAAPPPSTPEKTVPADTVAVEAIVTAYRPNAMRDHTEDGFAVFDGAEVRVTSPPEHAGRALTFYLSPPAAPDAPWREVGALLCFTLRPADLNPNRQLFGAAARELRRC